jgi:hypothetical protein
MGESSANFFLASHYTSELPPASARSGMFSGFIKGQVFEFPPLPPFLRVEGPGFFWVLLNSRVFALIRGPMA